MLRNKDIKKENDVISTDNVVKNDVKANAIMRMNRRTFVKVAGMTAGALALGNLGLIRTSYGQVAAQTQLPGKNIPQFVDPLPLLDLTASGTTGIDTLVAGTSEIGLHMREFQANVMPSTFVPATGTYTGTWVFGYIPGAAIQAAARATYIGPVIVATRHNPTQVRYVNNLTANQIAWRNWTDQSLHSAFNQIAGNPMATLGNAAHYMGPVPAVPHLHGGEDPGVTDGGPEAWFLSDQGDFTGVVSSQGPAYYAGTDVAGGGATPAAVNESIYRYPNSQEAAPLWFHDHVLGATRLNATFAGLAGAYALIDPTLNLPAGLHPIGLGADINGLPERPLVPLVIQDRMFDTNGQLFFPNVGINPEHPYWIPEFVGDTIVVNGRVWPFMMVDQQRYRFYLINGSNSRPYDMFLEDGAGIKGPRMWVIATDGGYLDAPVLIDPNATKKLGVQQSLMMMPGERYEIIIDFADPVWKALLAARRIKFPLNLILRNVAPTVNGKPTPSVDGRIMQFRVSATVPVSDTSYDPASGTPIRTGAQTIKRLVNPATGALTVTANKTRELTLNEITGRGGPLEVLVNNSKWNGLSSDTTTFPGGVRSDSTLVNGNYLTELPTEGETEVWEIVNTTVDNHPIHLHGVQFQLLNRQAFDTKGFGAAYAAAFPGGVFIAAYGPPKDYDPALNSLSGGKYGGNPDITPYLLGLLTPPLAYEAGWKDTVIMPPGQVTRIAVRFAPQDVTIGAAGSFIFDPNAPSSSGQPGYYVWHCHITDHEDNEMMRPDQFQPNTANRSYVQGVDY